MNNIKFHYHVYRNSPSVPIRNQVTPVHALPFYFLNIYFNIVLPSVPWSSKWSLSSRLPHQNPVYIYSVSHTWHIFLEVQHVIKVLFSASHVLRTTLRCTIEPNPKEFSPAITTRPFFLNVCGTIMLHILSNLKWGSLEEASARISCLSHPKSMAKLIELTITIPCDCWVLRFFFVVKGPAADARDASQPWGLLCNPMMKMISVFFCFSV
jgi:hypothetical protein